MGQLLQQRQYQDLVPSPSKLLEASHDLVSHLLKQSLTASPSIIYDDLLPYHIPNTPLGQTKYDAEGRSTFARRLEAALAILRSDPSQVRSSYEIFYLLLITGRILEDEEICRGSSLGMYRSDIPRHYIQAIRSELDDLNSYAINGLAMDLPAQWHQETMSAIAKGNMDQSSTLARVIDRLIAQCDTDVMSPRVLRSLLSRVLAISGEQTTIERWLAFSQSLSDKR